MAKECCSMFVSYSGVVQYKIFVGLKNEDLLIQGINGLLHTTCSTVYTQANYIFVRSGSFSFVQSGVCLVRVHLHENDNHTEISRAWASIC